MIHPSPNDVGRPVLHHVVIIGCGFGGLFAARALKGAPVSVTVLDRRNHHLFQPLLYQVATGILSEGQIAPPIRDVFRGYPDTRVVMAEVQRIDVEARVVHADEFGQSMAIPYDSLIVACGAETSYFGHEEFKPYVCTMKSLDDALTLRGRIFGAFELAEAATDDAERRRLMTFVIVGGGPTGVEMAGQLRELAQRALRNNYRRIDPRHARVVLVEGVDHSGPLDGDPSVASGRTGPTPDGSRGAPRSDGDGHRRTWRGDHEVGQDDPARRGRDQGVGGRDAGGGDRRRPGGWRRGATQPVRPSGGRTRLLAPGPSRSLRCRGPHGDSATSPVWPKSPSSPGCMLHARFGAAWTARRRGRFRYRDLGTLAVVSRFGAVAKIGFVEVGGFVGWLLWLVVHLAFLTGFKNRFGALARWAVSFVGRGRYERALTGRWIAGKGGSRVMEHGSGSGR